MLVGDWTGTSRLVRPWLSPPDAESEPTASVSAVARGKFITIEYTRIVDESGVVTVLGSYAAPAGPDWKWRTTITPRAAFEIAKFNFSPDGEETPAFESRYMRRA